MSCAQLKQIEHPTSRQVNRALEQLGYEIKLRQAQGYCYFVGINPNTNLWDTHTVVTCYVANLSLKEWIGELEQWLAATR